MNTVGWTEGQRRSDGGKSLEKWEGGMPGFKMSKEILGDSIEHAAGRES